MSDSAANNQPKTPRTRHRAPKPGGNEGDDVAASGNNGRQRQNQRRNRQQNGPRLEDAIVQGQAGDFDANGNFVSGDMTASNRKQTNRRQQKPREVGQSNDYSQASAQYIPNQSYPHATHHSNVAPVRIDTPAKPTAYAGPTFHASPAPSALPMPKFFSKSVPAVTQTPGLQARLDQEAHEAQHSPAPAPKQVTPPQLPAHVVDTRQHQASPLDMFFKADREERAKQMQPKQTMTPPSKPTLPVPQTEPAQSNNYWSQIYGQDSRRHSRHLSGSSGREMFMMELDGQAAQRRGGPSPQSLPQDLPDERVRSVTTPSTAPSYQQAQPPSDIPGRAAPTPQHASQLNNFVPMTAPHDSRINGGARSQSHEQSPFYRPQYPRSAGNTPAPLSDHQSMPMPHPDQQQYHYGNKNLSPLFKAARTAPGYPDSPAIRRASSLRQEVNADAASPEQYMRPHQSSGHYNAYGPGSSYTNSQDQQLPSAGMSSQDMLNRLRSLQAQSKPQQEQQKRPVSSGNPMHDAAALSYLQSQMGPQAHAMGPPNGFVQHQSLIRNHSNGNAVPQSGRSNDVKSMEADLKRLLNLGGGAMGGTS